MKIIPTTFDEYIKPYHQVRKYKDCKIVINRISKHNCVYKCFDYGDSEITYFGLDLFDNVKTAKEAINYFIENVYTFHYQSGNISQEQYKQLCNKYL